MKIVIVGFGNIGRGLASSLLKKKEMLHQVHGLLPKVVAVVDEHGAAVDDHGLSLELLLKTAEKRGTVASYPGKGKREKSALEVIEGTEADLVFELTPTNINTGEPGLTHIRRAMLSEKHVITSNKGPLVVAFRELDELARKQGVEFRYSASVGGAVPVIGMAKRMLAGNKITAIRGILNGTTNYILTRMEREGAPFDVVLREAQELGVAEKDPTLDIEGIDTACKITILANSIMGINARLKDVKREGIRRVNRNAMKLASEAGYAVKLIGSIENGGLEVGPGLVPRNHPLAVDGTLNAVTFELDLAREITITGFGAGPKETSSSLLGDLLDIHHELRK